MHPPVRYNRGQGMKTRTINAMKSKREVYVALLLLLLPAAVLAQRNPKAGFIITNTNDTVRGFIDYRGDVSCGRECTFCTEGQGEYVKYSPADIKGYRFSDNGVYYVSRTLPVDGTDKTFFAEFLLQGGLSLYRHVEELTEYFYLENADGELSEVKNEIPEHLTEAAKRQTRKKIFHSITKMVDKSPKAVQDVARKPITPRNLMETVREYNEDFCKDAGECVVFQYNMKKNNVVKVDYRAEAGYEWATLDLQTAKFAGSMPFVAIGADVRLLRYGRGLALEGLLSVGRWKTHDTHDGTTLAMTSLVAQIGPSYRFIAARAVQPFVHVGGKVSHVSSFSTLKYYAEKYCHTDYQSDIYLGYYAGGGVHVPLKQLRLVFTADYCKLKDGTDSARKWLSGWTLKAGVIF